MAEQPVDDDELAAVSALHAHGAWRYSRPIQRHPGTGISGFCPGNGPVHEHGAQHCGS